MTKRKINLPPSPLGAFLSTIALATSASIAYAQSASVSPPNSGTLLQGVAGTKTGVKEDPALDTLLRNSAPIADVEGLKVTISEYRFSGLTVMPAAQLTALTKKFAGADKRFQDILDAAATARAALVAKGYFLADVLVPAQTIKDGAVELVVLEGRLGKINVRINKDARVTEAFIRSHLSTLTPGTLLNTSVVERSIFLLQDLRGIKLDYNFSPGATTGTADLTITASKGGFWGGLAEVDNYGSVYTGSTRFGGAVDAANVFGRGDLLNLRLLTAIDYDRRQGISREGLDFARISYLLPLNGNGTKLGAAVSNLKYELGREFTALRANGDAKVNSLILLHPFVRSRNLNLILSVQADQRTFTDRQGVIGIESKNKTNIAALTIGGDFRDDFARGGTTTFAISASAGKLSFGDANDLLADEGTLRAAGRYSKYNLSLTRLQRFIGDTTLYGSYIQQVSNKNLYTSEKISLGGPNGVRAYPQGEGVGDEGFIGTLELRAPLRMSNWLGQAQNLVLVGFVDYGESKFIKKPYQPSALNTARVVGHGVGVNWGLGDQWSLRSSLAWRHTQRATSETADRRPRFFLQIGRQF